MIKHKEKCRCRKCAQQERQASRRRMKNGILTGMVLGSIALAGGIKLYNRLFEPKYSESQQSKNADANTLPVAVPAPRTEPNTAPVSQHAYQCPNEANTVRIKEANAPLEKKVIDYQTKDFLNDNDEVLLARMLFGEIREGSAIDMALVAYTAINRANDAKKWNGESVREAVLMPRQYSCFNRKDVNFKKVKDPMKYDKESFRKCLEVSREILSSNSYAKYNFGQTHYYNPEGANPDCAKSEKMKYLGKLGNSQHVFYKEK